MVAGTSPTNESVNSRPRTSILVVDDNPIDRSIVAAVIRHSLGLEVSCVEDGARALQEMRRQIPSLVVTDLQMPRMSGLELIEQIRTEFPLTPVVLTTAFGSEKTAIEALRRGAASYIPKSNINADLANTLEQILAATRHESESQDADKRLVHAQLYFILENEVALVRGLVSRLKQELCSFLKFSHCEVTRVGIALEEALLNALYHGNLEVSSELKQDGDAPFFDLVRQRQREEPYAARRIHVKAEYFTDSAVFVIRDEGPGFDSSTLPDPTDPENLCKPSGRGTMLIRTFLDEVSYNRTGNEITLCKRKSLVVS